MFGSGLDGGHHVRGLQVLFKRLGRVAGNRLKVLGGKVLVLLISRRLDFLQGGQVLYHPVWISAHPELSLKDMRRLVHIHDGHLEVLGQEIRHLLVRDRFGTRQRVLLVVVRTRIEQDTDRSLGPRRWVKRS